MSIDSKHPDYAEWVGDWIEMRDCLRGSKAIKEKGKTYLPMPNGYKAQDDGGTEMFAAYQARAKFPDILGPTIRGMVGLIHSREAAITLPPAIEGMTERATRDGLPLEIFHQRVTLEVLLQGRYGILTDFASNGSATDLPFLSGYSTESIINWAEDRSMFVLDESGLKRVEGGYNYVQQNKYRELLLADGKYSQTVHDSGNEEIVAPNALRGKDITEIPFQVVGATGLLLEPERPPLKGVAEASLALYRLDADYRHQLFMTGQETLFIIGYRGNQTPAPSTEGLPIKPRRGKDAVAGAKTGGGLPKFVGAGAVVGLPAGADAKYVGTSGVGLAAMRLAMQDEAQSALASGVQLFDKQSGQESGEALRLRYSAQSATLKTIAISVAAGLEKALRAAAVFMGADPTKVVVKPNLEFVDMGLTPESAMKLVEMWQADAISYSTMYTRLQAGRIASEERNADEERALIEVENPLKDPPPDPNNPPDPEPGDDPEDDHDAPPLDA